MIAQADETQTTGRVQLWVGRVLTALPILLLAFSAFMKLRHAPEVVQPFTAQFGWPETALLPLGLVELGCALVYAVPQTSVLGAVLITGYLGGAVATHARLGQPFIMPALLGAMAWGGLWLRDGRLRQLLPLRR